MYSVFELTLCVNHACNLQCSYCYTGNKFRRPMPVETGEAAIRRAVHSVQPEGTLQLGFFGGEPLIEAARILDWMDFARELTRKRGCNAGFAVTTNGTLVTDYPWQVMTCDDLALTISHDGLPEVHDRFRLTVAGTGSSYDVLATIDRLVENGRDFTVVMVIRPETVLSLPDGVACLRERGVQHINPSLDLWTDWDGAAGRNLETAIAKAADLWAASQPGFGVSWFDSRAAALADVHCEESARCGFGDGQIAVSPAGNLYPCERLIGEDRDGNPMRLPGDVFQGFDFTDVEPAMAGRSAAACTNCGIRSVCSTFCRCSNYIRTKDVSRPDGLLCLLDRLCHRETLRVLNERFTNERVSHVLGEECHV